MLNPIKSKSAILDSSILYRIYHFDNNNDDFDDYEYKVIYCYYNNTIYLQFTDKFDKFDKSYEGFFTNKSNNNFLLDSYNMIDKCLTTNNDKCYATVEKVNINRVDTKLVISFIYTDENNKTKINIINLNEKKRVF
jgi:hypothetical protein